MSHVCVNAFLAHLLQPIDSCGSSLAQQAIDAAEASIEQYIGDTLDEMADGFGSLPSPIVSAIQILAQVEFGALEIQRERKLRDRVEALLRPYRREAGCSDTSAA